MIEETLQAIEFGRMSELEALEQAKSMRDQETSGYRQDVPQRLRSLRDAPAYYGIVRECLQGRLSEEVFADMATQVEALIEKHKIRDWENNPDVLNIMRNAIEDYLYSIEKAQSIRFSNVELDEIIEQVIDIARKRA
jgi:hypothetical protein